MKKKDLQNWREKSKAELAGEVKNLSVKLTSAYLTKSANKLQNTSLIKQLRRDIAQLKTIAHEQELKEKQA